MTVIADDEEVHDIGGIMGGEHSGVTEATTDIVIECAYFDARADRADRAEARPRLRRAQPLRARRRSRLPRGRRSSSPPRWRSSSPAASLRRSSAPGRRPSPTRVSTTIRRAARASAASPCPRTGRQEILQRLGFVVTARGSLADRGAVMASRRGRRRPTSSRRWSASRASTRSPRRRCRARRAWRGRPRPPSS